MWTPSTDASSSRTTDVSLFRLAGLVPASDVEQMLSLSGRRARCMVTPSQLWSGRMSIVSSVRSCFIPFPWGRRVSPLRSSSTQAGEGSSALRCPFRLRALRRCPRRCEYCVGLVQSLHPHAKAFVMHCEGLLVPSRRPSSEVMKDLSYIAKCYFLHCMAQRPAANGGTAEDAAARMAEWGWAGGVPKTP